jgi:hypothetical protein
MPHCVLAARSAAPNSGCRRALSEAPWYQIATSPSPRFAAQFVAQFIAIIAASLLASTCLALPPAGASAAQAGVTPAAAQLPSNAARFPRETLGIDEPRITGKRSVKTTDKAATPTSSSDVPVRDEKSYVDAARRCALAQTKREREDCE